MPVHGAEGWAMTAGTRPRTRLFFVLIIVATLLASVIVAWTNAFSPRPLAADASAPPGRASASGPNAPASVPPTRTPESAWTFRTTPDGPEIRVAYELPASLELTVGEYDEY